MVICDDKCGGCNTWVSGEYRALRCRGGRAELKAVEWHDINQGAFNRTVQ